MNRFLALATALVAVAALAGADVADAKRMGGGGGLGAQRRVTPAPTPTPAPGATQAAPAPAQAIPGKAAAPAAGAAAPSGMSRWLGPLAGLAAGIGLASLLSHFGLSESFANLMLIALVVVGGFFVVRMLLARRQPAAAPLRYANANAGAAPRADRQEPFVAPPAAQFEPVFGGATPQAAAAPATGSYPPGFDPAPFIEQAKVQFRKLQDAYDRDDRKALSEVMTPEMYADVTRELAARGPHLPTEVVRLEAQILEVTTEGSKYWMSVHFTGLLREDGTVLPKDFDEIWNLVKPVDGATGWLLAGIQQTNEVA